MNVDRKNSQQKQTSFQSSNEEKKYFNFNIMKLKADM